MDIDGLSGGAAVPSAAHTTFERLNPVTRRVAARAPAAPKADVDAAVAAPDPAFAPVPEPEVRAAVMLNRAADDTAAAGVIGQRMPVGGGRSASGWSVIAST